MRFAVGDRVLLSTQHLKLIGERKRARKLTERYIGPYRVNRVVNANAYELELPASLKIHPVINISHLKEYRDGAQAFPDRPVTGVVRAVATQAEYTPRVALTERERADLLFAVRAEFRDTTQFLKAGLPVTVRLARARPRARP